MQFRTFFKNKIKLYISLIIKLYFLRIFSSIVIGIVEKENPIQIRLYIHRTVNFMFQISKRHLMNIEKNKNKKEKIFKRNIEPCLRKKISRDKYRALS